jgi:hypothetical protein
VAEYVVYEITDVMKLIPFCMGESEDDSGLFEVFRSEDYFEASHRIDEVRASKRGGRFCLFEEGY